MKCNAYSPEKEAPRGGKFWLDSVTLPLFDLHPKEVGHRSDNPDRQKRVGLVLTCKTLLTQSYSSSLFFFLAFSHGVTSSKSELRLDFQHVLKKESLYQNISEQKRNSRRYQDPSSHLLAITENHSQKMCKRVQLHLPNCCGTSTTCKWVELLAIFTTTPAMSRAIDLWTTKGNPALQKQRGRSTDALMLFKWKLFFLLEDLWVELWNLLAAAELEHSEPLR